MPISNPSGRLALVIRALIRVLLVIGVESESALFDAAVPQKGLAHLKEKKIALDKPLPPKSDITPYWRDCLDALYTCHGGMCAYLAIFFERVTGGRSLENE